MFDYRECSLLYKYRRTLLFSRDRDFKNRLAYNKLAYKNTKNNCKYEDRSGSRKTAISQSHIREIADKKAAYNEGYLY